MKTHNNTKQHTTIAKLLLFSIGILFSYNTFAAKPSTPKPYTVHKIGQVYGGGIVFYVYDGGQHGLIAATEDQNGGNGIRWYGGSNTITRANASGVGAGKANTALIIANQASVDGAPFAATVCNEYSAFDTYGVAYGDWYLPSQNELFILNGQKDVVGGFRENGPYWSSNEDNDSLALVLVFFDGPNPDFWTKSGHGLVRCVRSF